MKAPRCKLCGKEHYGLCKGKVRPGPLDIIPVKRVTMEELGKIFSKKPPLKVPGPPIEDVELALVSPDDPEIEITDLQRGTPLTPAEKQKAYRERGGDELKEKDRLRKRRKRGVQDS